MWAKIKSFNTEEYVTDGRNETLVEFTGLCDIEQFIAVAKHLNDDDPKFEIVVKKTAEAIGD